MGCHGSWLAGITLLLLSLEGSGRQVKRQSANQILDTLSLTPKNPNALSTISRKSDLPLAACDKTRRLLHRGDWYHKQGAASDLCTAEWLKLDAEEQALFVKVQTLEDLGDQAWLYQQQHDQLPTPKQLPTVHLDSKTVLKAAEQIDAKANTAGAQINSLMEKVLPPEVLNRTKTEIGIGALAVVMVVWAVTRSNICKRMPKSLAAELLAEEEQEEARKAAAEGRARKPVPLGSSSAAKERKVQRNRSRKERRRLVDGMEDKELTIDYDDDTRSSSGSTGSQSESGEGPQLLEPQLLEEEGSWMPAKPKKSPVAVEPPQEKSSRTRSKKAPAAAKASQQRATPHTNSSNNRSPPKRNGSGGGKASAAAPPKPSNGKKEQPQQSKPKAAPAPAPRLAPRPAPAPAPTPAPTPAAASPAPAPEREKKPRNNRGKSEKDGEKQNGRRENGRGNSFKDGKARTNSQQAGKTGSGGGGGGGGSRQPRTSGEKPPRKVAKSEKATPAARSPANAWTARSTPPMDNKPELPKMVFDMTPAVAGPKPTMLSPAFATQKSPANSRPDAGKTRGGTPQSVPSSPRILFGAFDQWDGVPPAAADLERDTSLAPPVHEVEAPEDVSLVAVEKVQCNGKAYLVDRANRVVYDFEDGLNEVLDPEPVGAWDEESKTIELYAVTQDPV